MKGYHDSKTAAAIRDLYRTPPEIVAYYDHQVHGFACDVAATAQNSVVPGHFITEEQNALEVDWSDYLKPGAGNTVWCNPPYSDIGPWVRQAIEQAKTNQITTLLLVPADPSVGWFAEAVEAASRVEFISAGRVSFIDAATGAPKGGNNKGSAVIWIEPIGLVYPAVTTYPNRDVIMETGRRYLSKQAAAA